jgi:hypothetical protein
MKMTKASERRLHLRRNLRGVGILDALLAKVQQKNDFDERDVAPGQPLSQFSSDRSKPFVFATE